MNNINIAISCESNLTILLEEFLNLNSLKVNSKLLNKEILLKNDIDLLIIDDKSEGLEDILQELKNSSINVILLGYSYSGIKIRNLMKNQLIYDYLEKNSFVLLNEVIKTFEEDRYRTSKIIVRDTSMDTCIDIKQITYISYDRELRKSIITTDIGEFFTKKNLSEIEVLLEPFKIFLRAERGIILNETKIQNIDYREEKLSFDCGSTLMLSKKTLKNLRKSLIMWDNHVKF